MVFQFHSIYEGQPCQQWHVSIRIGMRLTDILQPLPIPMPPISCFVAVGIAAELVAVPMSIIMEVRVDMPDISMANEEIRWLQLAVYLGYQEIG
jgi:hypothetical protein